GGGVYGADQPVAEVFGHPHGVAPADPGLPELHLLAGGGFGFGEECVIFEVPKHVPPGPVFEIHQGFGVGHGGVANIKFGAGFGGGFAVKWPDHVGGSLGSGSALFFGVEKLVDAFDFAVQLAGFGVADIGLHGDRDTRTVGGHRLDTVFQDRHDVVPVPFNLGKH